jgi:hypothetical protein
MDSSMVKKKELISLLDNGLEFEQAIFNEFSGEEFSSSNELIKVEGIRDIFELLIPKTTWTKLDYERVWSNISIEGTVKDAQSSQLIIGISDEINTFRTTTDSIAQLFTPMKMNQYASYLLEDQQDHLDLLLHNFDYWFKNQQPEEPILIRTVIENGIYIARCFATPKYKPIDNHVLLYLSLWALNDLGMQFRLATRRIDHSSMKLDFMAEEDIIISGIGKLNYGFTVINSESKEKTVGFYPTFELINNDGTTATIIVDKPITIVHRGNSIKPIVQKLSEINEIKHHLQWVLEIIHLASKAKIDDVLAYRIQQSISQIIGSKEFSKFADKYAEISANNTFNLLQFFGRLNEISVPDEDKYIKIRVLFWKYLSALKRNDNS